MATTPSNPLSKLFDTNGKATIYNTTTATSTTTGALIVAGGVGIGQNLWLTGAINLVTEASDTAKIYTEMSGATSNMVLEVSDDVASDAIILRHRHYNFSPLNLDIAKFQRKTATEGTITLAGDVIIGGYTTATSTATGSLQVVGGIGLSGSIYVSSSATIQSTLQTTTTGTGALVVTGGAGIGGNLAIGGYTYYNSIKTAHLYVKGSGLNNGANALITINGAPIYNGAARGLTLAILNKSTLLPISVASYDTYGFATSATQLAAALDGMTNTQIGILVSYDAIEAGINTTLIASAKAKGLFKLAYGAIAGSRRPYAAVFAPTGSLSIGSKNVIEVYENDNFTAPQAVISTDLVTDGTAQGGGFSGGANLTNVLISGESDTLQPVVAVDNTGSTWITGQTVITNTTNATSTGTGALQVRGGVGIGGDLYFNGNLYQGGTLFASGGDYVEVYTLTNKILAGNFITLPNSRTYTLTAGAGRSYLNVIVDGYTMARNVDYTETSTTAITTNIGLPIGSTLQFRISRL